MKKISIAFLAAMSLASFGCPNKKTAGDGIAKMTEFKDSMCACKDRACTERVTEEMTRWGQEQAKAGADKDVKMSEEDMKKSAALSEEMGKCMTKILTEAAGAAGGAAEGSAGVAGGGAAAGSAEGSAEGSAGAAGGGAAAGSGSGSASGAAAGSAH
jgi:hypothetical protein